jgi:NADPH2:quinone reductase
VLIIAGAIGVNFVDTYFRTGLYPHQLPFVPGAEVAGIVAAVGEEVTAPRMMPTRSPDRTSCSET